MTAQKSKRTKKCRNCGAPVRRTQGNLGYCKRCVRKALAEQEERATPNVECGICGRRYTRRGVGDDWMCGTCGNALIDANERLPNRRQE